MYEAKQNKEKVSRTIGGDGGATKQNVKYKTSMRKFFIIQKEPIDTELVKIRFSTLIQEDKYTEAVQYLNRIYFNNEHTDKISAVDKGKASIHASVSGVKRSEINDDREIVFNENYLIKMDDGSNESFYKVINTLKHERKHFEQRSDPDYFTNTTKEEREFMAYSEELIKTEGIPQLTDQYYTSTYNRMKKNYEQIMKNPQIINKNTYKQRFDSIPPPRIFNPSAMSIRICNPKRKRSIRICNPKR